MRGSVHVTVSFFASDANRSQLVALLNKYCQISSAAIPQDSESLAGFLTAWFRAVRGNPGSDAALIGTQISRRILPIGFARTTEPSGQIAATQSVFSAGIPRIFGVFENHSWRSDLSLILAVWRDIERDKVIFQEFESIVTHAASNYVGLSPEQGWPIGHWQLELYDPGLNFTLLAKGAFSTQ